MNHPEKSKLAMLKAGALPANEADALLAHISECDECALTLAGIAEANPVLPPASLEEDILARVLPELQRAKPNPRREYVLYCFRVCAAVCAALVLVFSGLFKELSVYAAARNREPNRLYQYTEKLGTELSELFDRLDQLEVVKNANKTE